VSAGWLVLWLPACLPAWVVGFTGWLPSFLNWLVRSLAAHSLQVVRLLLARSSAAWLNRHAQANNPVCNIAPGARHN
jgi:hypothetical protein